MKFATSTLCFMGAQAVQLGQWSMPMNLAQTQTQVTGLVMAQISADCPTWAMDSKAQIDADCPTWAMDSKAQIDADCPTWAMDSKAQIDADCPTWAMDSKAQIGADCPTWAMDHKAQIDRKDVEGVLDSAERDDE